MIGTSCARYLASVALLLIVAACGGPGGSAAGPTPAGSGAVGGSTAKPVDSGGPPAATSTPGGGAVGAACDLLTDEQIKAVTGFAVTSEKAGPQMGIYENGCEWEIASDGIVPNEINLGVLSPGGRTYYDTYFGPYEEGPAIAGLGDVAVEGTAGAVIAVQDDVLVDLQYVSFPTDIDTAKRLVQAVFDSIGR